MQHSLIVGFLSGAVPPEAFAAEIDEEVAAFYADLRKTRNGFINISPGPTFNMTRSATRRLLSAVVADQLSPDAAVYVADCIFASDDIEIDDDVVREALAFLEDDTSRHTGDGNTLWTQEEVAEVMESLS